MIRFEHVSKEYSAKVVDDLNLEIKDGEIFGFLGPNGAGKTTTIKMMIGVTQCTSGSISIGGFDIAQQPIDAKKQFGYVPDSPDVFLKLKGMEYLNFIADIYEVGEGERNARIAQMAQSFGMEAALSSRIQSYSHGMRQKIVLMGALVHQPHIWILDEPMTGLDPKTSHQLKQMMRTHADAGNTVFFSTHVLEVAEKLCDRVGIIKSGKLIFVGTMEELRAQQHEDSSLEEMFLELTEDA